ncbi:MAG TPA: hypothetical protein VF983_02170 [Streptosporangiaceae bacterium]
MKAATDPPPGLAPGMEDTITFSRGRPVCDAELVERAATLAGVAQRTR